MQRLICAILFSMVSASDAYADREPAVIYDGSEVQTIEVHEPEKSKDTQREQGKDIDFGKVQHRHTKIKFVNFKNKTDHVITCRGAAFTGEGFGYVVENLEVEPGETVSLQLSFYANPSSAIGGKKGKLDIRYAHNEPGQEDVLSIQMKAQVSK